MPETLCRLAVHNDGITVDLALPGTVELIVLLPSIVDIVRDHHDAIAHEGRWRLYRSDGHALDEALTLSQNRVRDGELLWLTTDDPPPARCTEQDACQVVANAAATTDVTAYLSIILSVAAASLGAGALLWRALATGDAPWLLGAGLSTGAVAAAVVSDRTSHLRPSSLACSLIAVLFAAVAGAIAVPAGPAAAHLVLASAAACAVSTLLLRLIGCGTAALTGLTTLTLLLAVASIAGALWELPPAAIGASLATLSLAAVSMAPRVAIVATGISPGPPDDASRPTVDELRASLAHNTLTGLVSGSSIAAAAGAGFVLYGYATSPQSPLPAAAFTAVVGAVLMLRARTHLGPARRCALITSGWLSGATAFAIILMAAPSFADWLSVVAVAAAVGAMAAPLGPAVGPVAQRVVEISESAALAAVVPLACWIAGVYRLVRDSALL